MEKKINAGTLQCRLWKKRSRQGRYSAAYGKKDTRRDVTVPLMEKKIKAGTLQCRLWKKR
jgi:hypothetical protein